MEAFEDIQLYGVSCLLVLFETHIERGQLVVDIVQCLGSHHEFISQLCKCLNISAELRGKIEGRPIGVIYVPAGKFVDLHSFFLLDHFLPTLHEVQEVLADPPLFDFKAICIMFDTDEFVGQSFNGGLEGGVELIDWTLHFKSLSLPQEFLYLLFLYASTVGFVLHAPWVGFALG
jgi:hypothetical protein